MRRTAALLFLLTTLAAASACSARKTTAQVPSGVQVPQVPQAAQAGAQTVPNGKKPGVVAQAQTQSVAQSDGVYFVAYRTPSHINRSSPTVFHGVAEDLIAYLKSKNVKIVEDPERGILQTDESISTESLCNLAKNAGARYLLLVTVDRPMAKWLKVTIRAYELTGNLLWTEEASSGSGLTGGGAPGKVLKTLGKKLEPLVGTPGLPTVQPAPASEKPGDGSSPPGKPEKTAAGRTP